MSKILVTIWNTIPDDRRVALQIQNHYPTKASVEALASVQGVDWHVVCGSTVSLEINPSRTWEHTAPEVFQVLAAALGVGVAELQLSDGSDPESDLSWIIGLAQRLG